MKHRQASTNKTMDIYTSKNINGGLILDGAFNQHAKRLLRECFRCLPTFVETSQNNWYYNKMPYSGAFEWYRSIKRCQEWDILYTVWWERFSLPVSCSSPRRLWIGFLFRYNIKLFCNRQSYYSSWLHLNNINVIQMGGCVEIIWSIIIMTLVI